MYIPIQRAVLGTVIALRTSLWKPIHFLFLKGPMKFVPTLCLVSTLGVSCALPSFAQKIDSKPASGSILKNPAELTFILDPRPLALKDFLWTEPTVSVDGVDVSAAAQALAAGASAVPAGKDDFILAEQVMDGTTVNVKVYGLRGKPGRHRITIKVQPKDPKQVKPLAFEGTYMLPPALATEP
jgi:hypothetical protein